MRLVFAHFVEVPLPNEVLATVVHVIGGAVPKLLYLMIEVFHELAVTVRKDHVVSTLVVVLDAPTRIGEHVGP